MNQIYIWQVILNQEWLAIILSFFILNALILLLPSFRSNKFLFSFMLFIINIRFWLILINVYMFPLPGSDQDAIRFQRNAYELANENIKPDNFIGANLYEYILSLILKYISSNPIYIHLASNIIFILAVYTLLLLLLKLKIDRKTIVMIIILLNLLPSVLMNTVTTLREPYQIFFLILAIYSMYNYIKNEKNIYLITFIFSVIIFGMLHNGLLVISPLLFLIFSITYILSKEFTIKSLIFAIFSMLFFITSLLLMGTGVLSSQASDAVFSGESLQYAENYRVSSPDARATYQGVFDTSNLLTMIVTGSLLFIKYMIFPLPWMISSPIDIIAIIENIIRLFLIIYILRKQIISKIVLSFFIMFILIEFVWSLGTSNWGTASRHHIIALPILLFIFSYVRTYHKR